MLYGLDVREGPIATCQQRHRWCLQKNAAQMAAISWRLTRQEFDVHGIDAANQRRRLRDAVNEHEPVVTVAAAEEPPGSLPRAELPNGAGAGDRRESVRAVWATDVCPIAFLSRGGEAVP